MHETFRSLSSPGNRYVPPSWDAARPSLSLTTCITGPVLRFGDPERSNTSREGHKMGSPVGISPLHSNARTGGSSEPGGLDKDCAMTLASKSLRSCKILSLGERCNAKVRAVVRKKQFVIVNSTSSARDVSGLSTSRSSTFARAGSPDSRST